MSCDAEKEPIDVAAGLVFSQGKLLLTQRRAEDHLGGLWEFPGGKREPGEDFAACLKRELREELGIEVEVGELIDTVTHHYPDRSVRLAFLRCRLVHGQPAPLGCQALVWVTAPELAQYQLPAADARLVARLVQTQALWG